MRQLAIECASEACSLALFEDGALIASRHEILGRGHAERLIPFIEALPDRGKAERILVSRGPGSFTGVRIGIAAARALALAWQAEVMSFPTLALVAATAQSEHPGQALTVCMNGGHGEWFMQGFDAAGMPSTELAALPIADAANFSLEKLIAGNRAKPLGAACEGEHRALDLLPDARHALAIPTSLLSSDTSPLYGRAPDAKLPQ
jgi:tRNA threonylcarbamoyl adenosine modification protein YeaZ